MIETNALTLTTGIPAKKNSKFFTLSLFLHLLKNCLQIGFWLFQQVSVILRKKPGNAVSNPSASCCISLTSHAGKFLERIRNERIRSLDVLIFDVKQKGFTKSPLPWILYINLIYDLKTKIKTRDSCVASFSDRPRGDVWLNWSWPSILLLTEKQCRVKKNFRWLIIFLKQENIESEIKTSRKNPSTHPMPFPRMVFSHL